MKRLFHFLKLAWSVSPSYILLLIADAFCNAAKNVLNVILPMFLVDELLGQKQVETLIFYGGMIVLNNVGMTLLSKIFARFLAVNRAKSREGMMKRMSEKIMNLEYAYLENPKYLDLKERAVFAVENQDAIAGLIVRMSEVLSMAITMAGLVTVLISLGWVLIVVLVVAVVLMLSLYSGFAKVQANVMQQIIPVNRRFSYYMSLSSDLDAQGDIRIYDMEPMITDRVMEFSSTTCDMFEVMYRKVGKAMGMMNAVTEGVAAISYAYVGLRTISDAFGPQLSIGALTMYVSAAINLSGMVARFGSGVVELIQFLSYLEPYMEFMSLKEKQNSDGKEPFTGTVESIEFDHVNFTYPAAEQPVLTDVSFSLKKGEKISIVGLNGAGKSTLVKLLCRMYEPDSGVIRVNGKSISDYEYLSYIHVISAVFQDYALFHYTIAENISCQDSHGDEERIKKLIEEVGMKDKIEELPQGIHSRFGKEYDRDGIEMSGGQTQKIAIARALYKNASMVILDEPASALDPMAEAEIYEKFNSLVEDKTAIYISHRMSSSVFCDRILILDGGTVADFDTHENLMKKTDSLYYKLFMSQADNYRLEAEY